MCTCKLMMVLGKSGSVGAPFYLDRFMSEVIAPCSWIIDADLGRWKSLMMSYISSPLLLAPLLIKHDGQDEYSMTMISLIKLLKNLPNASQTNMVWLYFNRCAYSTGSYVIYAPIDVEAIRS